MGAPIVSPVHRTALSRIGEPAKSNAHSSLRTAIASVPLLFSLACSDEHPITVNVPPQQPPPVEVTVKPPSVTIKIPSDKGKNGSPDAGVSDAAGSDARALDLGVPDTGVFDARIPDAMVPDARSALSLCGDPREVRIGATVTLNQLEGFILNDSYILQYLSATASENAIFRILNRADLSVVSEFTAERNRDYRIVDSEGNELLVLAVCSVNAAFDFSTRSVEVATDRELERWFPPESVEEAVCEGIRMTVGQMLLIGDDTFLYYAETREEGEYFRLYGADGSYFGDFTASRGSTVRIPGSTPTVWLDLELCETEDPASIEIRVTTDSVPEDAPIFFMPDEECTPEPVVCGPEEPFLPEEEFEVFDPQNSDRSYRARTVREDLADGRLQYRIEFEGGLPICDRSEGGIWSVCGGEGLDALGNHRIDLNFMGQRLRINHFNVFQIDLGHVFREGVLSPGDSINTPQCNRVRLMGILPEPREALVRVEDLEGITLRMSLIGENETRGMGGDPAYLYAGHIVPGYAPGVAWAELATLYSELVLRDGAAPQFNGEPVAGWNTQFQWDGLGRLLSITLTAPADALFPRCE